jgi:hypothetical protein
MKFSQSILIAAMFCFGGCSAQTDKSIHEEHRSDEGQIAEQASRVAPNKCRMVATVMAIDSTLEKDGPCSKAPCRGIVRVDSIIGYGSAFGSPIAVNTEIEVRFAFTVAPTNKDLFPNLTQRLPGLRLGTRFQTDIESQHELGVGVRHPSYLVQMYKRLN